MADRWWDDGHTVAVEIDCYGARLVFACTDPSRCKWQDDGECHFLLFMENGDPEESITHVWRPTRLPVPIETCWRDVHGEVADWRVLSVAYSRPISTTEADRILKEAVEREAKRG